MKCPKCKTIELSKEELNSPFSCRNCGGTWLADTAAPDFSGSLAEIPDPASPDRDNDGKTGLCPSGHGIMIRARVDIDEPFYLEKCVACGGIWFDKGERRKIIEGNFTEHLKDLWSRSWQSKQRKEQSRTRFLEINEEVLGKEVFEAIIELAEKLKQHPEKGRAIALLQQEIS